MSLKLANLVSSILWFWDDSIDLYKSLSLNIKNGIQDSKELFLILRKNSHRELRVDKCEEILELGWEAADSDP